MDHRARSGIRFVNGRMGERLGGSNSGALASKPVPGEIIGNDSGVIRQCQLADLPSCGTCNVKPQALTLPDTHVPKTDAAGVHTDHSKFKKFAAAPVQFVKHGDASHYHRRLIAYELNRTCFAY